MIICVCNNVNSETIRSSIEEGALSVEEIREATGASSCCGKCKFKVNGLLQESTPKQQCLLQANQ